jgi:hypothetical protein
MPRSAKRARARVCLCLRVRECVRACVRVYACACAPFRNVAFSPCAVRLRSVLPPFLPGVHPASVSHCCTHYSIRAPLIYQVAVGRHAQLVESEEELASHLEASIHSDDMAVLRTAISRAQAHADEPRLTKLLQACFSCEYRLYHTSWTRQRCIAAGIDRSRRALGDDRGGCAAGTTPPPRKRRWLPGTLQACRVVTCTHACRRMTYIHAAALEWRNCGDVCSAWDGWR